MSGRRKPGRTPPRRVWGPWYVDPRSPLPNGSMLVGNGLYTVHLEFQDQEAKLAGAVHLSIHDRGRTTKHDWRDFQRIKNELCGEDREAIEIYPAERRLVDESNEYHLWVMPEGIDVGWGFEQRSVADDIVLDASDPAVAAAIAAIGGDPKKVNQAKQRRLPAIETVRCLVCGEPTRGEPVHEDCDDSSVLEDGRGPIPTEDVP